MIFEVEYIIVYLLAAIGTYAGLNFLYECSRSPVAILWSVIFPNREQFSKRYGKWAVITGSSDGIGKQYAINLASKGLNVFLISRTESKLVEVAREIRSKYDVDVKWIAIDFSEGPKIYDTIQNALSGIEVGVLVNNVGLVHQNPLDFEQLSRKDVQQTLSVNTGATVMMSHMLLPEMKRRRRGMVVNMSSCAGIGPMPYVALYGATKAFLNSFTLALREELRGSGVQCQLVIPLFVITNLNAQWKSIGWWTAFATGVEKFTKHAVFTIGRTSFTTGYWAHGVQITMMLLSPRWMLTKSIYYLMKPYRKEFHGIKKESNQVDGNKSLP